MTYFEWPFSTATCSAVCFLSFVIRIIFFMSLSYKNLTQIHVYVCTCIYIVHTRYSNRVIPNTIKSAFIQLKCVSLNAYGPCSLNVCVQRITPIMLIGHRETSPYHQSSTAYIHVATSNLSPAKDHSYKLWNLPCPHAFVLHPHCPLPLHLNHHPHPRSQD